MQRVAFGLDSVCDGQLLERFEQGCAEGCLFREIDLAVHLGWVSPEASLLFFFPIPTCLPVTPRMSHSVPGQSPQGYHLLLETDHPLAPGWSLVWLLLGAQKGAPCRQ